MRTFPRPLINRQAFHDQKVELSDYLIKNTIKPVHDENNAKRDKIIANNVKRDKNNALCEKKIGFFENSNLGEKPDHPNFSR